MKIIAMIPARLNSKRVYRKNLRLINGIPLIGYVLKNINKCQCFDEVYLNSESNIFEKIAKEYSIKFYKRDEKFSKDTSTNDEFGLDFIEKIKGDILIQILPTSPLITTMEIESFVKTMVKDNYDTLISVENKQIACVFDKKPINFNKLLTNPPSQTMIPIKSYATVLMGWKYDIFKRNMDKFNSAYHGGNGKTGYFSLTGLSTIDIDSEEDFDLVEKIILSKYINNNEKKYYSQ